MALKNDSKNSLREMLKSTGYGDADHNAAGFASNLGELSRPILRRVRALKKVQLESLQIESQFYQKVHELEKEFQPLFDKVSVKRRAIVTGEYEPKDEEADLPLLHGVSPQELEKLEQDAPEEGEPSKGVPGFWFNAINNVAQISDTIKEYDEPILKYLVDVTSDVHMNPPGFTLNFHFAENPYFKNSVLTKYYELDIGLDAQQPFDYDGPNIVKSKGCEIQWNEGKNVTQKVVKKKQKKGPNAGKFTSKTVSSESFFNFFEPNEKTMPEGVAHPEEENKISEDFEIGQILRDQVIPRAVLFFTGEAAEDDDYDDFDDEDEDNEGNETVSDED